MEVTIARVEDGELPIEPGEHTGLSIFDQEEVLVDNGYGDLVPPV